MRASVILVLFLVLLSGLAASLLIKAPYEKQDLKEDVLDYRISEEIDAVSGRNAEQIRPVHYTSSNGNTRIDTVLYIYSSSSLSNRRLEEAKTGTSIKVSSGKAYFHQSGCVWKNRNAVLTIDGKESVTDSEMKSLCKQAPKFLESHSLLSEKTGLL